MSKLSNFGYSKVTPKEKTKLVQKVFSDVANNYDLMNDVMSFGAHRLWKKSFIDIVNPSAGDKIIDVGSGSGDLVLEILKRDLNLKIDMIDLNKKMLLEGKKRIKNNNVKFFQQNAEKLNFLNNIYDKYLISFCLRNVTDIDQSFKEAFRILKPGGQYYCLEFSRPNSFVLANIYSYYKSNIIPTFGKIFSNNRDAYNYLNQSIDLFPNQDDLKKRIETAGFKSVKYTNLFDGIVSIHTGYKY
ncbi:MAG: ubiquinone/menaquinone biosynthesis methyltransferase [Alphaproteobacteria bacterium]|nr:ubiquinone/menaquinone biosynthesis methyltransferase [Alphaproteobacteria bacterium]